MAEPRPRLFRVTIRLRDGSRRSRIVKAPYYERDPLTSLYGLQAQLASLLLDGTITRWSVSVPETIGPRQRERLVRWPTALPEMLAA